MPASDLLKTNIKSGDVINGWQIVRDIMAPPGQARVWRAVGPCGHDAKVHEAALLMGAVPACQKCLGR